MTETNEMTPSENLDWIRNLLNSLPEMPTVRKDILSIAGFPNWENVHSNILAFYFDENEEHGFGRLFLDSLLELCGRELGDFSSDYTVDREVSCDNNKRIDLLIQSNSDEWAIIVENKIYAELYNSLGIYWKAPKNVENKVGVVLSLHKVEIPAKHKNNFINVTHGQLLEKVKSNLGQYYMTADDRHLLILKEYIVNIENRKRNEEKMTVLNRKLDIYKEYKEIRAFIDDYHKTLKEVNEELNQAMIALGFGRLGRKGLEDRRWQRFEIKKDGGLASTYADLRTRFNIGVDIRGILEEKTLYLYFQLEHKESLRFGEKLEESCVHLFEDKDCVEQMKNGQKDERGKNKEAKNYFYRIFKIKKELPAEEKALKDTIIDAMKELGMNAKEGEENSELLSGVLEEFQKIIKV